MVMAAVYFIAGFIAGLAVAWYFTKQHYDSLTVKEEEHRKITDKLQPESDSEATDKSRGELHNEK